MNDIPVVCQNPNVTEPQRDYSRRFKPISVHFIRGGNGTSPAPPTVRRTARRQEVHISCGNMFFIHFIRAWRYGSLREGAPPKAVGESA